MSINNNSFVITTVQPRISSLTYDGDNCTLTCVYTGSPTTTVSWEKDGVPLSTDGSSYHMTQTVTDRASSTHFIVLTVSEMRWDGMDGRDPGMGSGTGWDVFPLIHT